MSLPSPFLGLSEQRVQMGPRCGECIICDVLGSADGRIKPIRNKACGSHDAGGSSAADSMHMDRVLAS
ncbi:hypothetical protein B7P43_G15972 [Cryptotermes secundus]|uniref:Uncharacterized protein n=1 Tax=Cryptotermes secundus TaxID=105785 RepID=A0A2J7PGZ0_9NEOP|nr:hypothetical protein B7P43_G15972 [Cryptotermes secundus]